MPLPLAPPVMVIQDALGVAVHEQLVPVVTLNDPVPPLLGTEPLVDPNVYEQAVPLCVIVNDWPAAVMTAERCDVPVLAATLKLTVPLPDPLAPPVMVTQVAASVAVHAQPAAALTTKDDEPPAAEAA